MLSMLHRNAIVALIFVPLLLTSLSAYAHPFENNSGYASHIRTNTTISTRVDGIYYRVKVEFMDVPFNNGSSGTNPPCGNNSCIVGGNARPVMIVATYPPNSAANVEFLAIGYAAGCAGAVCTDVHPNGGVYKRWYQDGNICDPWYNCGYWFSGSELTALSAGTWNTFQLQRNGGAPGGGYWWRGWHQNQSMREFHRNGHRPQMWRGNGVFGAENSNAIQLDGSGPDLSLHQDDWRTIRYHEYGWASTNPPGTTNYQFPDGWTNSNPHAGCWMQNVGLDYRDGRGSC